MATSLTDEELQEHLDNAEEVKRDWISGKSRGDLLISAGDVIAMIEEIQSARTVRSPITLVEYEHAPESSTWITKDNITNAEQFVIESMERGGITAATIYSGRIESQWSRKTTYQAEKAKAKKK